MASRSFDILFYADVLISLAVAAFVFFFLPETRLQLTNKANQPEESFREAMRGLARC